jgi:SAM-dependent methyltransferase
MERTHDVIRALRLGQRVEDAVFDRVYPEAIQRVSSRFWTPVNAGLIAAGWLNALGCRSVLDVGAGAGKFCIVVSLALDRTVVGIEQRAHLVEAARSAAVAYGAPVHAVHGTIEAVDPRDFEGFYLFNPFQENVFDEDSQLDAEVELSEARWFRDLARVESWLDAAKEGTAVITYNGFGGRIPASYRLRRTALVGGSWLRLWTKRIGSASGFFVEIDEVVLSSCDLDRIAEQTMIEGDRARMHALLTRPFGEPPG